MKILSVDVGGTFLKYAALDEAANFFLQNKIPTPKKNYSAFLQKIFEIFQSDNFDGIAISLPGIIDNQRGFCVKSSALDFNSKKFIADDLKKICKIPVAVENDSNCAALAEIKIGNLSDVDDAFVIVFGTMIGGTFIKNKKIHRGKNFLSGEISFLLDDSQKFFWQTCSTESILKNYKNLTGNLLTGEKFFENIDSTGEFLNKVTEKIAQKIFNLQMVLDFEKVAIGGGISQQKIFIDFIKKNLEIIYKNCPVEFPRVEVVPCKFHNDANLIGALFNWLSFVV